MPCQKSALSEEGEEEEEKNSQGLNVPKRYETRRGEKIPLYAFISYYIVNLSGSQEIRQIGRWVGRQGGRIRQVG